MVSHEYDLPLVFDTAAENILRLEAGLEKLVSHGQKDFAVETPSVVESLRQRSGLLLDVPRRSFAAHSP
ncbi:MAG: hypothetical protein WBB99_16620 [Rhodococcus sp. (in: high G+C Gram-positive bacteria)]|nr:hypothetical protein [uncultured Rhodococcus sp.]